METIKNYVVIDECYNFMDDTNFKAIPDKYKTLHIYMTYGRADGAINKLRVESGNYSVDDSLCVITDTVDDFMRDVKGKDRMLIIKWIFEIYEDNHEFDIETGKVSRHDGEEEGVCEECEQPTVDPEDRLCHCCYHKTCDEGECWCEGL